MAICELVFSCIALVALLLLLASVVWRVFFVSRDPDDDFLESEDCYDFSDRRESPPTPRVPVDDDSNDVRCSE
jgi:hypothetical protein